MALKKIKGGKHPQTIAEEQSKKRADKNANDLGLIAKAIEKLKKNIKIMNKVAVCKIVECWAHCPHCGEYQNKTDIIDGRKSEEVAVKCDTCFKPFIITLK